MTFRKPDNSYWDRKFIAYMHDPVDKVFRIPGHGERAAQFLDRYGLQKPNEDFWKKADAVAAGFERGQVPTYSSDPNRNGAVDFLKNPVLTHPTSEIANLQVLGIENRASEEISEGLLSFIENEVGMRPGEGGYSDEFKGDDQRFSVARFLYTHLVLRFRLAHDDVAGLGALWHRIPADSRFPDHSIWQHNALCSAIYSCIELGENESEVGIMVFSITPVQQFIAKARKLRDYWTGSILLSWLSFEGMRWVIENLGPDHILYPSLIDQPLVNEYMKREWRVAQESFLNPPQNIASFPNKFLFLVPMNMAEEIASEIKDCVHNAWKGLSEKICNTCVSMLGDFLSHEEREFVREIFERQNASFWELPWAACRLTTKTDLSEIERLLPENAYRGQFDVLKHFDRIIADKRHYEKSGRGTLYSVTHCLVQAALASAKIRKTISRPHETGEKCHLCGEFEVLHHKRYKEGLSAGKYKENTRAFWNELKVKWDGDKENRLGYNLNSNERLCSICLTKRMAYQTMGKNEDHILQSVFAGSGDFPSTTEVALHDYFERKHVPKEERRAAAQRIHQEADDRTENQDCYFAILLMDGDNMGKLINGETLAATWESVMHPDLVSRLKDPNFEKKYHDNWVEIFKKFDRRLITPAVHAAISESLGDFSLYGVADIVRNHNGKLIYAGGDDVCAVLPVGSSLDAAKKIQQYYISSYNLIQKGKPPQTVTGPWEPVPGKLSINLGKGDDISISAGILICHHKENLSQMIARAHQLLETKAKKVKGKNACAIELRKRSGGSRYFVARWDDKRKIDNFLKLGDAVKSGDKAQVSSSVIYRLERLRDGIEAIIKQDNYEEMLQKLIMKQLDRSSVGDKIQKEEFAERMSDIVLWRTDEGKVEYRPESLIVAAFTSWKKEVEDVGMV